MAPVRALADGLTLPSAPTVLRAWSVGTLLQARVVAVPAAGTVTLQVGADRMQGRMENPPAVGSLLQLRVTELGPPTVLKAEVRGDAPPAEPLETRTLRALLPRAESLEPTLEAVETLHRAPGRGENAPALARAAESLVTNLPTPERLTSAPALRQAVLDSGIFLEARLADAAVTGHADDLKGDLKANMLRLLEVAMPTRGEPEAQDALRMPAAKDGSGMSSTAPSQSERPMAALLDSALARIELSQMQSARATTPTSATWVIDLPVRAPEGMHVIGLRVEQHESRASAGAASESTFSVSVSIPMGVLGTLHARLALRGEQLSAGLWADSSEAVAMVQSHLDALDARLRAAGIDCAGLHCFKGTPPSASEPALSPTGLVNLRV